MKPAFEQLANEWKGHEVGLVAGIDCTEEDELCQTMQVQGFPTIMYGDPNDPEVSGRCFGIMVVPQPFIISRTKEVAATKNCPSFVTNTYPSQFAV